MKIFSFFGFKKLKVTIFSLLFLSLALLASNKLFIGNVAAYVPVTYYCRMWLYNFNQNPLKVCNEQIGGYLGRDTGLDQFNPQYPKIKAQAWLEYPNPANSNPKDTRCSVIQYDNGLAHPYGDTYVRYSADSKNYCHYEEGNDKCVFDGTDGKPAGTFVFNNTNQDRLEALWQPGKVCGTPVNTPTPTKTPTPTPTKTPTPTPAPVCTWSSFTGWVDQYRSHSNSNIYSYSSVNTPKQLAAVNAKYTTLKVIYEQEQINDNDGGNCNPQFNEEAYVYTTLNGNKTGTGYLFKDGNYDTYGDQKLTSPVLTYTVEKNKTYGLNSIWAGDGRIDVNYYAPTARNYIEPIEGIVYKYPQKLIKSTTNYPYSTDNCRWNGSYRIRVKWCN